MDLRELNFSNFSLPSSNNEILEYILRPRFIKSDDITFFVEDEYQSSDNDFNNRNIKISLPYHGVRKRGGAI